MDEIEAERVKRTIHKFDSLECGVCDATIGYVKCILLDASFLCDKCYENAKQNKGA